MSGSILRKERKLYTAAAAYVCAGQSCATAVMRPVLHAARDRRTLYAPVVRCSDI